MSGYREHSFDPSGRTRKPTRWEWVAAVILIFFGVGMMYSAIAGSSAPGWMQQFRLWPVPISELLLGITFLLRAHHYGPGERYSQRGLRQTALLFFALAAITVVVELLPYFKGA